MVIGRLKIRAMLRESTLSLKSFCAETVVTANYNLDRPGGPQ